MKKYLNGLITTMFLLFLAFMFFLLFLLPKKSFSETENRYLARFPEISVIKVSNGSFGEDFETFLCDNFPFRDGFISIRTNILRLMQNTEINGVYVGDDILFDTFENIDKELEKNQIQAINSFVEKVDAPVYFAIAPNSLYINSHMLPPNAQVVNQKSYIDNIYNSIDCPSIDLCTQLTTFKDEYLYYRTDHHWTTLGAFYAYEKICADMHVTASSITDYEIEEVSDSFLGTFHSKGNFSVSPDTIYKFDNGGKVSLEYDNGAVTETFYYDEFLSKKDKYSYFLGGTPAFLKISSGINNGKTLVVIKDSYSHCMAPFLASSFETVYLIDLRYLNNDIVEMVNELDATHILVLYNAKTFSEDRNILKMGM